MSEFPDIPHHLKESVVSVEAYEQRERRAFQIRDRARMMRILPENFEGSATVNRYVSVLRDSLAGVERLGNREWRGMKPISKIETSAPAVAAGLRQAAALYKAESVILEEGFYGPWEAEGPGQPIDIGPDGLHSLSRPLNRAVRPYGLEVAPSEGWAGWWHGLDRDDKLSYSEPALVTGVWTGAPVTLVGEEPWVRGGDPDRGYEWYWADMPGERHDREHHAALATEAERLGLSPEAAQQDLVKHTLLSALVYGRQLAEETEQPEGLPPAPGLTPSAQSRLARVAPLNRLAVAILEEAARPGRLTAKQVAGQLEPVMSPSGLVIRPADEV